MRVAAFALHLSIAFVFGLVLPQEGRAEQDGSKRPFRLDDVFDAEELGTPLFSPDGQSVAFTRLRPASSQLTNGLLIPQTRSDVWVQLAPGQPVRNLTNGAEDSSGWWDPRWSPDGQHLSFLSSRGGNVTVWIWARATNKIRQLSTDGIEFEGESAGCQYVDNARIVCLAVPEGERSTPMGSGSSHAGRGVESATAAWARAGRGELTASVVDSLAFRYPQRRLMVMNIGGGDRKTIATTICCIRNRDFPTWSLSPDGKTVAFVRDTAAEFPFEILNRMGFPAEIELRSIRGEPIRLNNNLPANVLTSSLVWSPDGRELAFFAYGKDTPHPTLVYGESTAKEVRYRTGASIENPAKLWRIDITHLTADVQALNEIDLGRVARPPRFMWTASGELLFRARRSSAKSDSQTHTPDEWLVLDRSGHMRPAAKNVTSDHVLPSSLEPVSGARFFIGLSDKRLWIVDPNVGIANDATPHLRSPVQQLRVDDSSALRTSVLIRVGEPPAHATERDVDSDIPEYALGFNDYRFDLVSRNPVALRKPSVQAYLVALHESGMSIYQADTGSGTTLWRSDGSGSQEQLVTINTYQKSLRPLDQRVIEYISLNGDKLLAKVTLPVGYNPGRRYPTVVSSDIGYDPKISLSAFVPTSSEPPPTTDVEAATFAASGYVYMFVSMPTTSGMDEVGRANLLLFTNGLLPAVQKIVDIGIADPQRLFLYGWSSFGYGALGVITQTTRFRAAAVGAAFSDQIAATLSIDPTRRYSSNPFGATRLRPGYSNIGLPFWRNADHLRRNSPISYVDRVQTPVMIIHGDHDPVPISDSEAFFIALVMQRKSARFVRYWGEGHFMVTPVNTRDVYQRILAWFDEHGDILRDGLGNMSFDGERVKSRGTSPPLTSEEFSRFGPTAHAQESHTASRKPVSQP